MIEAPIPNNESQRLAALKALNILDTAAEERFDRITRMAQWIFNVPISTLTLVDSNREWFKSCVGVDVKEGPRAISFCGHAMLADELFIIPDTKKDARFADNPMVVDKPFIRFYAGQSLSNIAGIRIGTFCLKDTKPRELTEQERIMLKNLAAWAEQEINLHDIGIAYKEAQLAEQKRFQAVLESAPDAMITVNDKGVITLVNSQSEKLIGYNRQELLGNSTKIFLAEDLNKLYERYKEQPAGTGIDIFAVSKDGRKIPIEVNLGLIKHEGENLVIASMRDISERKLKETALRKAHQELVDREKVLRQTFNELNNAHDDIKQAQNQLVQSEKMASIGQLAAGVAHELNNPVGFIGNNMEIMEQYITGYIEVLRLAAQLKEKVVANDLDGAKAVAEQMAKMEEEINLEYMISDMPKLLEHSRKGVERIRKTATDLRTFSREDNDEMEQVKIEDVLESILSIVHNEVKYKATLEKKYGGTPVIHCNSQRMGQVFINLIINSVHAIEEKGTIELKTYSAGEFVGIDIHDTGKGIKPENLNKIFDPFFTTKPAGQGTGLGLSISNEIVKKHGGTITVQSKVGVGTTFTIMLPITPKKE